MSSFRDLKIYDRSYKLAIEIHKYFTNKNLNKNFAYDLIDQVLRSSRTIPANIAEGFGKKKFKKDFIRYLWIAIGSKDETLVHLDFLKDLKYLDENTHKVFCNELDELGKMLFSLTEKIHNEIKDEENKIKK